MGRLDRYSKLIKGFNKTLGLACWALVYQTDVRARSERMQRLHMSVLKRHNEAVAADANAKTGYEVKRPWNAVFKSVMDDDTWWTRELYQPGLIIAAKIRGVASFIEGDATIAGNQTPTPRTQGARTGHPATVVGTPPPPFVGGAASGTLRNR